MRPGKAPASPNSRNVIVGHKKPVKDDMFVAGADSHGSRATNPNQKRPLMSFEKKVSINPVEDDSEATAPPVKKLPSFETASAEADADTSGPQIDKEFTSPPSPKTEEPAPEAVPAKPEPAVTTAPPLEKDPLPPAPTPTPEKEEEKPTPQQVAISQVVETPSVEETKPEPAQQTSEPETEAQPEASGQQVHHDIVAQTSAPLLDHAVVSHHKQHTKWWVWVLVFLLIVALGLVALNFLLDAEVITTDVDVPYTNLIK